MKYRKRQISCRMNLEGKYQVELQLVCGHRKFVRKDQEPKVWAKCYQCVKKGLAC